MDVTAFTFSYFCDLVMQVASDLEIPIPRLSEENANLKVFKEMESVNLNALEIGIDEELYARFPSFRVTRMTTYAGCMTPRELHNHYGRSMRPASVTA